MAWHESKFWRGAAVAAIVVLAGTMLKMDSQAQRTRDGQSTDEPLQISTPDKPVLPEGFSTPLGAAPAQSTGSRRGVGRSADGRLSALQAIGLAPWDTTRGLFVSLSDSGDRITLWDLGSDWESSINLRVVNGQTFSANPAK